MIPAASLAIPNTAARGYKTGELCCIPRVQSHPIAANLVTSMEGAALCAITRPTECCSRRRCKG